MLSNTQSVRDIEGYFSDPHDWSRGLTKQPATEEGLKLSEDCGPILGFMREYWPEHRIAPDVRHIIEHLVFEQGYDKKSEETPLRFIAQQLRKTGMQDSG